MRLVCAAWIATSVQAQVDTIQAARIRAHVKFLSSDLLEGRGVGTRGGDLATEYLAAQFALAGLKPAGDQGTYFQKVPLIGATPTSESKLVLETAGKRMDLQWNDDFTGNSRQQRELAEFTGDAVFVGHGIVAPEFGWNDYAGVDAKGKVVVLFTNEPPSDDPKFFGGKALTYYGRWTYKFEEALRQGAAAALIIHTTPTAGYGWPVVQGFGREDAQVRLKPGENGLALAGWLTKRAAEGVAQSVGKSVDELLKLADTRGFKAIPLPVKFSGRMPMKIRTMDTRNVVGWVPGADPQGKNEAIVFSAHWDHLGIGPAVNGDTIYNGAVDNATGCGMLLELARAWASTPRPPRRSAVFIAVTAEEAGLRGADFYAQSGLFPPGKTALNVNFDSFFPFGRTKDAGFYGAERTTVWPTVQEIARRYNLEINSDPRPEQGSYYRSDHFSFARAGIPAFSVHGGNQFFGKSETYGDQLFFEYNSKHYHQPSDEFKDDWDFSGVEQMARVGYAIGWAVANQIPMPSWRPGDEFLKARQSSGVR